MSLGSGLARHRFLLARRASQAGVLLLFFGSLHWGWTVLGAPVLVGNLSASTLLGVVPLADPFAVLQIALTGHWPRTEVLLGAGLLLLVYGVLGGRSFCAWVCPVNVLTDAAESLRRRLRLRGELRLPRNTRYVILAMALLLSVLTGVAAFEWVSPIGVFHREVLYGAGFGAAALFGLFVFDALVLRHGWCGHLCPLGAFWAQVGRAAQLRVSFDEQSCTQCGDCVKACPEPQVIHFNEAGAAGMIRSGECTNCARCIAVCPEGSLAFDWRARIAARQARTSGASAPAQQGSSSS